MKNIAMKTAAAVVAGLFAFGIVAPTATMSAEKAAAPEMKMDKAKKMKPASDPAVSALQEALNNTGAKLKVDGLMGGKTKVALKKYQKANGLKVTGMLDDATKMKLGM
jgi:peptidoglycan hydrolase-like protein with peptidoglycan-binding domain